MAGPVSWRDEAACLGADPNIFFPHSQGTTVFSMHAKAICRGCRVRSECLDYAVSNGMGYGIWGGLTARTRKEMRRES